MTIEQIKSLLSRFYEGRTTPEEERQLAAYFRREGVPENLQQDKQLFLLLAETSEQEMPQDIADEITAFVNNLGQPDILPLTHVSKQRKGFTFLLKTPPKIFYRAAAAVALLVALGSGIWNYQHTTAPFRDTCATPEEAANAILYANDIIVRSSAPLQRSTAIATEQINDITETIIKIQPYINQ